MDYSSFHLTPFTWFLAILSAFLIGISKAGISSISLITVSILAYVFGSKTSTGILLPMLSFVDIFAVVFYNRHTQWNQLFKILPAMIVGVLLGVYFGKDISEPLFKKILAVLILFTVISMIWWEKQSSKKVPNHWLFSTSMGLGAGFTTMVGNMAGAFSNVYFLAIRLPKEHFIGTAAWLFLIINLFKMPFHIFVWHTINFNSLSINLALIPALILGFFVGIRLVKIIDEARFRKVILILTGLAALMIILSI